MRSEVVAIMQICVVAFYVMTMCTLGDGYKNLEEHTAAMYGVPYPSYTGSITLPWYTGTYLPDLTVHNPYHHNMYHGSSFLYLQIFSFFKWYVYYAHHIKILWEGMILNVVPPCILISTNYFLQWMHYLLKHKILQFLFKCFT
jgi:hypothetical protein